MSKRTRSSKAIGAAIYAPIVSALVSAAVALITALTGTIVSAIRAIRRRWKGEKECPPPQPPSS
jgi:hypothetical protein